MNIHEFQAKAVLARYGVEPGTRSAYALSHLDFEAAAARFGRVGGYAHIATLLKRLRARQPGSLLLDGGDAWQGSATALWTDGQDMVDAGKLLGVFGTVFVAVRLGVADMPASAGWPHLLGVALLCGIGFTMSLFIGLLAFADSEALQQSVKVGILAGSLAAAVLGALVLRLAPKPATDLDED